MSFLDRIAAANQHDPAQFRPFEVAGIAVGCVKPAFAATLARFPEVFAVAEDRVTLDPGLDTFEARTAAVDGVLRQLHGEGGIDGWRDEPYPVNRSFPEPALFNIERAAVPYFGIPGYGVHMNGYVRDGDTLMLWVATRSRFKPTGPGKLDQLVAGGQPAGIGLTENLVKECAEEASIPADLAARAVAVGAISYKLETPVGYRPDVIFNYDLELPADFAPVNTDGEIESFALWPIEQVVETVRDTDAYKFNCALVVIDFLIRHGIIPPDHPDYVDIIRGLSL